MNAKFTLMNRCGINAYKFRDKIEHRNMIGAIRSRRTRRFMVAISLVVSVLLIVGIQTAYAKTTVSLGTASPFAVLAHTGITNTGTTTIHGNVGSVPTPSETGFGTVTITGTNYPAGAPSATQTDLTAAIVQADGYSPSTILTALDGQSLVAGVYDSASGNFLLSGGVLTLNGQGDTSSVWIFQAPADIAGALSTTGGSVVLENGADSCNVFWVTSAGGATIGTSTAFVGTIMAHTSVTLATGATLRGAALANTGDVTMESNTISNVCVTATITTTTSSTNTTTTTHTSSVPEFPLGLLPVILLAIPILILLRRSRIGFRPLK
jgi:Ice-binding-like